MNQLTKCILFFLLINICGYSQNADFRYDIGHHPETNLPKFNDIEKVKYAKTVYYHSDSKKKLINYWFNTEIYIDKYPYRYLYNISTKTNDTISKRTYKYYEDKKTLEYVKEFDILNNRTTHSQYDKSGRIQKREVEYLFDNELRKAIMTWFYNSENLLIREESINYAKQGIQKGINYYLYNESHQLAKKVSSFNNTINTITTWAYNDDKIYYETENILFKEGIEFPIPQREEYVSDPRISGIIPNMSKAIKEVEEQTKYSYDKHKNWMKQTYEFKNITDNKFIFSITEREIIYK